MTNLEVLKATCNAICNTFYPDHSTMSMMLFNSGIEASAAAKPMDVEVIKIALHLVKGYVETSRNENGVSTSSSEVQVNKNILHWCKRCKLDASEFGVGTSIRNGSNRW